MSPARNRTQNREVGIYHSTYRGDIAHRKTSEGRGNKKGATLESRYVARWRSIENRERRRGEEVGTVQDLVRTLHTTYRYVKVYYLLEKYLVVNLMYKKYHTTVQSVASTDRPADGEVRYLYPTVYLTFPFVLIWNELFKLSKVF
jgi:phage regulator Rha-like protein